MTGPARRRLHRVAPITAFPSSAPRAARIDRVRALNRPVGRANLPATPSALIGRVADVAALRELLLRPDVRLVTLTGPPGIGKTRLALAVAAEAVTSLGHGAYFVDLAPVSDTTLVPSAIAQAIGVAERGDRSMQEQLQRALRDLTVLLVLDNFEQILEAAHQLADLLTACPGVKLLVTSRAPLHLRWEHEYQVPPLALPDHIASRMPAELAASPAVALCLERARAVQASFVLNAQTARDLADLCVRREGLPLAIELAARQLRHFPPAALLTRIAQQLPLAPSTPRDLPARQRTLRAAIDWSYNLLDPAAQALFRRLAVFVGGCSLEAIEYVCTTDEADPDRRVIDPLGGLATLMDHSLVRLLSGSDGEPRYGMLESIREYALDQLRTCGEEDHWRRRHAAYYLRLAEAEERGYEGGRRPAGMLADLLAGLARLELEHENLRAALGWIDGDGSVEEALRLAAALGWFWHLHGYLDEGRRWLSKMTTRTAAEQQTLPRAAALHRLGVLAEIAGDLPAAREPLEESAAICRTIGHSRALAVALGGLAYAFPYDDERARTTTAEASQLWRRLGSAAGIAEMLIRQSFSASAQNDIPLAARLLEEAMTLCRTVDSGVILAVAESAAGWLAVLVGDGEQGRRLFEEALTRFRALGAFLGAAHCLTVLGALAAQEGDLVRAAAYQQDALDLVLYTNNPRQIGPIRRHQGWIALAQGRTASAIDLFQESLALGEAAQESLDIVASLCALGEGAVQAMQPRQAVRFFAAAARQREEAHLTVRPRVLDGYDEAAWDRYLAALRAQLGAADFALAWDEGQSLPVGAITTVAAEPEVVRPSAPPSAPTDPLTTREREVAALLTEGLTNRQIAERLVISERTASTHVANILGKLGFATRAQIAAWAAQRTAPPASPALRL